MGSFNQSHISNIKRFYRQSREKALTSTKTKSRLKSQLACTIQSYITRQQNQKENKTHLVLQSSRSNRPITGFTLQNEVVVNTRPRLEASIRRLKATSFAEKIEKTSNRCISKELKLPIKSIRPSAVIVRPLSKMLLHRKVPMENVVWKFE